MRFQDISIYPGTAGEVCSSHEAFCDQKVLPMAHFEPEVLLSLLLRPSFQWGSLAQHHLAPAPQLRACPFGWS